ncbi:MAG: leucine-rich repeat protein [Clostridia bacterium]|nr:leucine-rich repeat protein [Clostridia bacterium]
MLEGVTSIGDSVFSHCDGLTTVTIPVSLTDIDYFAFSDCNNLSDVYYSGTEEDWAKISIQSGNECLTGAKIHYGKKSDENFTVSDVVITENSFSAILNINNITEESAAAIVAFYDKNGKMIQIKFADISLQADTVNINIPVENKPYDNCVFMLWDSLQTMNPLCNTEIITQDQFITE